MKPLLDVLEQTTTYLSEKGFARSKRMAEEIIAAALGVKRINLYLEYERPLDESELEKCRSFLRRAATHEPLAYIEEKVLFFDAAIQVSRDVLIPRPETEILAAEIAKTLEKEPLDGKTLFDVATGSGCLGISLKKKFPMLNVVLTDLSSKALQIAKENASLNQVEVCFLEGDLFTPLKDKKADFLVCNPPYISEGDYIDLEPSVREFEPKMALVGGQTGLEFYQRISRGYRDILNPRGRLWLEIGHNQGDEILKLFSNEGAVMNDWSGKNRFFFLETDPLS